jgi:hypothetical protein
VRRAARQARAARPPALFGIAEPVVMPTMPLTRSRKLVLSKGLAMCPSARAVRARSSSNGSKVPASSITGMCAVDGSFLIVSHTS